MAWDGKERRRDDQRHQETLERLDKLNEGVWEISGNLKVVDEKLLGLEKTAINVKGQLDSHTAQDRWIQGLILAALLGLVVKTII